MRKLLTKVRAYGWYCPHCKEHKNIEQVNVVKVTKSRYMTMVCNDCHTEVVDCFLVKQQSKGRIEVGGATPNPIFMKLNCDKCPDRFRCFTRSDVIAEKYLQNVKTHEISSVPNVIDPRNIEGVRSYTGIYNSKLTTPPSCVYPDKEDCNNSWMRSNYNGQSYERCEYMKYNIKEKQWYCLRAV